MKTEYTKMLTSKNIQKIFGTYICLIVISFLLSGCGEELMKYDVNLETPIVESYLEEGKNTLTVKLFSLEIYSEDEFILSNPIKGLNLQVNQRTLTETTSGTYTLDLGDDTIRGNEVYDLYFSYQGKDIKATTTVPQVITGLTVEPQYITQSSYYYWNTDSIPDIILSWDDPDDGFYQVYTVNPNTSSGGFDTQFARRMMQPFQGNTYKLSPMDFRSVGGYQIYVYKVNREYVELYERISSTDLANPVSFIDNAFGIFTAMSVAKVNFRVIASED